VEAASGNFGFQIAYLKKDWDSTDEDRARPKGRSGNGSSGSAWHSVDGRSPAVSCPAPKVTAQAPHSSSAFALLPYVAPILDDGKNAHSSTCVPYSRHPFIRNPILGM